jgi:8-oxo-dGTP pyrophosphatase MutT (NUDIX family)
MGLGRVASGLFGALPSYLRIAWWGLAAPRLFERERLVVHQGVVRGDAGVLLALRSELRGWELPGGAARPGEAGEQAVAREILEETGISVRVDGCIAVYERSGFRPHRALIYRCSAVGGALRPSPETPRVAWFDPHGLPDTLFPWCRGPLADALSNPDAPLQRSEHQGVSTVLQALAIDLRMRISEGPERDPPPAGSAGGAGR